MNYGYLDDCQEKRNKNTAKEDWALLDDCLEHYSDLLRTQH
jgi:hypothetical protein